MPLYKTITVNEDIKVYIWFISETEDELQKGIVLTAHCQKRMDGMRSQLHRRGFLSIRHLMAEAGYQDHDLFYTPNGKPHLKDGTHISITHSYHFTGIIVSKRDEVGIDIERQRDKILRIAHKFTPISEYRTLANTEALITKLTMVWGAKESLYKVFATKGLSFLHHIYIANFSITDNETTGEIVYQGKQTPFLVHFVDLEDFTAVYAIQQVQH